MVNRLLLRLDALLVQASAKSLAKYSCHIDLHSVADKFLLVSLCSNKHIIGGETHNPFQFRNAEHSYRDLRKL